jgi:hypothetical protein
MSEGEGLTHAWLIIPFFRLLRLAETNVADPGSGVFLLLGPGFSGWKNPDPESGIDIPNHISESLV